MRRQGRERRSQWGTPVIIRPVGVHGTLRKEGAA